MSNSPTRRVHSVARLAGRSLRLTLVSALVLALACSEAGKEPTAPAQPPAAVPPAGPPPSVVAISPSMGSTGGATRAMITGTGLKEGAVVQLGNAYARGRVARGDPQGTILYFEVPPHAAGTVDVVVTNPSGAADTLAGAYTFALPQSFDFNGTWSGFGNSGQDIPITFTIQDNVLISVSCDSYATLTFSTPLLVINGEFSYNQDGISVSGRIVSAGNAVGTINLDPCTDTDWIAEKVGVGATAATLSRSRGTARSH